MRPGGVKSMLCPCLSSSKSEDDANAVECEDGVEQKSPFIAKKQLETKDGSQQGIIRKISAKKTVKEDLSLPGTSRRSRHDGVADQDEITFEFERQSNASSMHQIPSLHTEIDLGGGGREIARCRGERSNLSRHSVDDACSFRSALRIDRTPSLSYCSEAGVAKSSSILVNLPSSRGSLSSFGRWSAKRSPSSEGVRKGSIPSNITDAVSQSHHHINRIDIHNNSTPGMSPSWSNRNVSSQERKCT